MNPNGDELFELKERIVKLPLGDQLHLFELVLGNARRTMFTDHEAFARAMDEMAADPGIQAAFRGDDAPQPEARSAAG